jgi:hypothetical protein
MNYRCKYDLKDDEWQKIEMKWINVYFEWILKQYILDYIEFDLILISVLILIDLNSIICHVSSHIAPLPATIHSFERNQNFG